LKIKISKYFDVCIPTILGASSPGFSKNKSVLPVGVLPFEKIFHPLKITFDMIFVDYL
jgi:hypothetical protein